MRNGICPTPGRARTPLSRRESEVLVQKNARDLSVPCEYSILTSVVRLCIWQIHLPVWIVTSEVFRPSSSCRQLQRIRRSVFPRFLGRSLCGRALPIHLDPQDLPSPGLYVHRSPPAILSIYR